MPTNITEFKNRETTKVLEELLALAKDGKISGFAFACKMGIKDHGIGITGDYRTDPISAMAVTARIGHVLNSMYEHRQR